MSCNCSEFSDIQFLRKEVSRRIKDTKTLKNRLTLLSKSPDDEHSLFHCKECNQIWQMARAWVSGNEPYLFRVPDIEIDEWLQEHYQDPDELLDYVVSISEFDELPSGDKLCSIPECERTVIEGLSSCHRHHVLNLQKAGICPVYPVGRNFPPYEVGKYEP